MGLETGWGYQSADYRSGRQPSKIVPGGHGLVPGASARCPKLGKFAVQTLTLSCPARFTRVAQQRYLATLPKPTPTLIIGTNGHRLWPW
jgi:hypothetical protein